MLGTVAGEVSFTSGSGDLELVAGGRALVAKTGSGNITIGTAPADVRVTTASGDIRIDAVDAGEIRVKAASGDVQAGVRAGTAAWLDVHTVSGRVPQRPRRRPASRRPRTARCSCSCRRSAATSSWRGSEPAGVAGHVP